MYTLISRTCLHKLVIPFCPFFFPRPHSFFYFYVYLIILCFDCVVFLSILSSDIKINTTECFKLLNAGGWKGLLLGVMTLKVWGSDKKNKRIKNKTRRSRTGHLKQPTVLILLVQFLWVILPSLACNIEIYTENDRFLMVMPFISPYSLIKLTVYIVMMSKGQYKWSEFPWIEVRSK